MNEDASHLDEILRLFSDELVPAVAKLAEIEAGIPRILQAFESGLRDVRTQFFDGLQRGIRDHTESGRKLTESVEANRIHLLSLQTEMTKVSAESVGRDLKAANDALIETGTLVAIKAATEAVRRVLTPAITEMVDSIRVERVQLAASAQNASERMAAAAAKAQFDVATFNWQRWLLVALLVLSMGWVGTGLWRWIDNVWPWKLSDEQASSLQVGQAVRNHWTSLDRETQQSIQKLVDGK